ncbi:MAG: hypothetical protein FWJ87_12940 [Micromonosporaceae bacterium]
MTVGVLAHGIGGRQDLPLPFEDALAGAVIALLATFIILAFAWRRSKLRGDERGLALPGWLAGFLDSPAFRWSLRTAGLVIALWIVVALVAGPDLPVENPAPGALYVLLWVWVPLLSVLFGPVWRAVSPLRTLHMVLARVGRRDPADGVLTLPAGLGLWPAAVLLGAFVWLELVPATRATLEVVGLAIATYAVLMLVGSALFGSAWFAQADPFEVYSSLAARLSPLGRLRDGRLALRNPLDGLDSQPPVPGLAAVVLVLLGSTAYDSLTGAPAWIRMVQTSPLSPTLVGTLGLLGCIAILSAAYLLVTRLTGRVEGGRGRLPALFAHSLLPIALGYVVAHYYSLAVIEGQRTFILAGDPLGTGDNLWGLRPTDVSFALVTPTGVATLQVVAVVTGHILGAVAAHDRAVRLFPPEAARWGQIPLLLLMVGYTYLGLTLLFAA